MSSMTAVCSSTPRMAAWSSWAQTPGAFVLAACDQMRLAPRVHSSLSLQAGGGLLGLAGELDQLELRQHQAAELDQVVGVALVGGWFWLAVSLPSAADGRLEAALPS